MPGRERGYCQYCGWGVHVDDHPSRSYGFASREPADVVVQAFDVGAGNGLGAKEVPGQRFEIHGSACRRVQLTDQGLDIDEVGGQLGGHRDVVADERVGHERFEPARLAGSARCPGRLPRPPGLSQPWT